MMGNILGEFVKQCRKIDVDNWKLCNDEIMIESLFLDENHELFKRESLSDAE